MFWADGDSVESAGTAAQSLATKPEAVGLATSTGAAASMT